MNHGKSASPEDTKKFLEKVLKTPMRENKYSKMSEEDKIKLISEHHKEVMLIMGLDLEDDSLKDTPKRVAKMYINEIFAGLKENTFPKMTTVLNKMKVDQMVIECGIPVKSMCEHHFQPIVGLATIAYIPKDKILGLSKFNRTVDYFARRPQVQERLTKQIAEALSNAVESKDVAVFIDAVHFCVKMRGVKQDGCTTITSYMGGAFKEHPETRAEFMAIATRRNNN